MPEPAEPRASVVIVTFNRPALVARAIESAKAAGRAVEVVVVDNGSTDSTESELSGRRDIVYTRVAPNVPLAAARNLGIETSRCEYVTFLDDDDLRLPGSLDAQLAVLEAHPDAAFCYGPVLAADAKTGELTGERIPQTCATGDIFWPLLEHSTIRVPSVVTRRSSLVGAGGFYVGLNGVEDWDMWIRLAAERPVVAVDDPVAVYRVPRWDSGQMSSRIVHMLPGCVRTIDRALDLPRARQTPWRLRRERRRRARGRLSDILIFEAAAVLEAGGAPIARENLLAALKLMPSRSARPWTLQMLLQSFGRGRQRVHA